MRMLNKPEPGSTAGPSAEATELGTPASTSEGYALTDEDDSQSSARFG
jgi:hypothetical protein